MLNNKISKLILIISFLVFLITPTLVLADRLGTDMIEEGNIHLSNEDPRVVTIKIINLVLTFLGIISVVVVLVGGFKWMTSGGNQEQVGQAKKILIAGLIGLIIILLSWGISTFVITQVSQITTYS